jgi:hypothetical protein
MPSTFSTSLRLELIGDGEQSGVWGQTTNNNFGELLEQAITGRTDLNVTAGNITLTSLNGVVDEARSAVLAVTGTPGATRVITIPNVKKTYTVLNSTTNIIQVKTASGTAFDCPPSATAVVACDGLNGIQGSGIAPLTSPAFTGVPTAPTAAVTTNTTQLATTAFVNAEIANDTANLAPLASPAFTGVPTAPTAAVNTNTTQLATTAFVNAEIANDAPTKTGTGASGTWGISITGNAATATNATNVAVTTSSTASAFKIPFVNTISSTTGNYGLLQDDTATFTYNPSTNTLTAVNFSGALSGNATTVTSITSGQVTTALGYTPPQPNGTGASGTWGINITGNAATATNATTVTSITSGQVTTALGYFPVQQGTGIGQLSNIVKIGWTGSRLKATVDATDQGAFVFDIGNQTIGGNKTFSGVITSVAYNFAPTTSIFYDGRDAFIAIQGNNRFIVRENGDINIEGNNATKASGTTWINPSDARLKDNVVSYTKGLNELVQIQPKSFTFNGKGGSVAGLNAIGIIADEIEQVLPNTVQKRLAKLNPDDAEQTEVRYFDASELTWVMVNAIKEQQAIISAMEKRLEALEA